jgi:hypothetical protein
MPSTFNRSFRAEAREAVARAKAQLATGDHGRLRYAALDLRMAMEALTYDRAQAFAAEIPPQEYETWQPKKLLQVLLEIEPLADTNSTLRIGEESVPGQLASEVRPLGSETILNLQALKKHYDALGSYLHMPTLKQLKTGNDVDLTKLRDRCKKIVCDVEAALASTVYNITFGMFATYACDVCGKPIRKRLPTSGVPVEAQCFEPGCVGIYRVTPLEGKKAEWHPLQHDIDCPTEDCDYSQTVWARQIVLGAAWKCPKCEVRWAIGYGVFPAPDSSADQPP